MTVNGINYRLTKHGRKRFLERSGKTIPDTEIIRHCVTDTRAVWRPDWQEGYRLVTYLPVMA